jgi:3D (Asp-Asp-Asp) domain-containing protein
MLYIATAPIALDQVSFEIPETDTSSVEVVNETDLGEFVITAYTAGPESTGKERGDPGYGVTATGTTVQEGRTIAADWDVLPPNTEVKIEGFEGTFIVEDKGSAVNGKHIDVYTPDLEKAINWGKQARSVVIVE